MDKFEVIHCGWYMTIANKKGKDRHHCHVYKEDTAHMLVRLMYKKRIPKSDYLRECVRRVSRDKKYIARIDEAIRKDEKRKRKKEQQDLCKGVV